MPRRRGARGSTKSRTGPRRQGHPPPAPRSPAAPEVRELQAGTSVGEMSVIDATRPSAWVVAKGPCEVLPMHRDLVKRLIEKTSPVARNLLHLMTHWIRANTDQIVLDQEQI